MGSQLRALLIEIQLAPGSTLNERELCEQLGVSRRPLSEAMKLQASEGMTDPRRGTVKLVDIDVMHAFETMAEFEGQ